MDNLILEKLLSIETLLLDKKKVLNPDELANYTGYSKSTIYKMVQNNILPHSKPNGKHLFFDKDLIDQWLLSKGNKSKEQLKSDAYKYTTKHRK
ncbi:MULTISPECIES: helix-turn-helix transcriptional regulator [Empedobacter]|uniref:DNA-binding protein n=2 Tax=Empedobacter TaxID=59734 RepID=A0A3R8SJN8_9FLAO|nr:MULTISPECIES: helix-turn-helix domain-containing protein [Empedobacter]RRT86281.1 DNA-binding protein [Empedobacter falsenii]RRT86913.1 DNA-binding protein [Empedobacter falsenii]TGN24331.1 DNA-binding protein [Empedobacter tilapiae]